ncbi:ATP-binding cassette domain-containing protein, partial [Paenibacillus sepulcri]|nr:ATP-binding cassette domain-containing protein [Paenibacillus sepulcri]
MGCIVLNHVEKRYGKDKLYAVKDFNLEIEDGEFLVMVGPSGCGKSTTLRMIAGLEDISSGEIFIGDRLVNHLPSKDRDIAMVFQNYALYPNMNVYENIAFSLRMRKLPKHEIDLAVKKAARTLEIENFLGRKPKELS